MRFLLLLFALAAVHAQELPDAPSAVKARQQAARNAGCIPPKCETFYPPPKEHRIFDKPTVATWAGVGAITVYYVKTLPPCAQQDKKVVLPLIGGSYAFSYIAGRLIRKDKSKLTRFLAKNIVFSWTPVLLLSKTNKYGTCH